MGKKSKPILAVVILIIIVVASIIIGNIIDKGIPSKERADLNEIFLMEEENGNNKIAIILQDDVLSEKAYKIDENIYVEYEFAKQNLNHRFYWDNKENVLIYTTPTDIIKADVGSQDYYVTNTKYSENYAIVKAEGREVFISLDFVKKYTDIEFEYFKEPERVCITNQWGDVMIADAKEDSAVRLEAGIKKPILTNVSLEDTVYVLEKMEKWSKVYVTGGFIGYLKNDDIKKITESERSTAFTYSEYTNISKDFTINMAWHLVTNVEANAGLVDVTTSVKGLNVISPTWFKLSDNEGNVTSLADQSYVSRAHQLGYEVWAMVDDQSPDSDNAEVFPYTSKRERLSNHLIASAITNKIDGINIDLESIKPEFAEDYLQFLRELSVKCRKNGIVLSIDNYTPVTNERSYYDLKEQGIIADYIILMGYDEHWSGAPKAGSVASLPFVKLGIENALKLVEPSKLINAIPFYTRIWSETPEEYAPDGTKIIEDPAGNYVLDSRAVGMQFAENEIAANGAEKVWLEDQGQYYAEYEAENSLYRIWLEDERSVEEKMKLVKDNNLAGVSAWRLGLERSEIWDVIIKYTN